MLFHCWPNDGWCNFFVCNFQLHIHAKLALQMLFPFGVMIVPNIFGITAFLTKNNTNIDITLGMVISLCPTTKKIDFDDLTPFVSPPFDMPSPYVANHQTISY